jgi:NADPH2:quinone reductase
MKAIRVHQFGGPEVMRLEEIPDLRAGSGQVLVRVRAAGVNPVDTYIRSGAYGNMYPLPYTPGIDAAGIIEATGERVYLSGSVTGTYAELAVCERSQVHPLPDSLSFSQGAAINVPYATAYRALFQKAMAKPGETVLVHGASGGVGVAAIQLAAAAGCNVIGTAGSERGLALVREQGAHQVLDHRKPDYLNGVEANVILEMLANVNLGKDFTALAKFGRVVVIGSRGEVQVAPREIMRRDATVYGMLLFNMPAEEKVCVHAALAEGFNSGKLRPVVGKEFPLAEAGLAHEAVMQPGAYGKIVLLP